MNTATCNRLSGLRVLLVEDVVSLRRAACLMLELEGAEVTEASSASEATGLVSAHVVDVVLTDLGLPDLSGEAVVTAIRAASRDRVPIIVLSAAGELDLACALRAGAERVFRKPFDGEVLVRHLTRLAARARQRSRAEGTRAPLFGST